MKKAAFTLAEVLITLGVIGVVVAMTIPTFIHEYKIRQFRTGFWRTSSLIQNALNQTAKEFGYDSYKDFYYICGGLPKSSVASCRSENEDLFKQISDDFLSRFKVMNDISGAQLYNKKIKMKDFSGLYSTSYSQLYGITTFHTPYGAGHILIDGTLISSITFFYHEPSDGFSITFDTNGPYKGPNRYGYDIFLFNVGYWYKLCSAKAGGRIFNGRGCYDYAKQDINPDDKTKSYWKSLK